MSDDSYAAARDKALDRLTTFADGTVAIALTLLVLPLVDVAQDARDRPVARLLADNWPSLFGFLLSFVVITRVWAGHRRTFQMLRDFDGVIAWLTHGWLLTVVFLPFPTALLASDAELRDGSAPLYIATLLASGLLGAALSAYMLGHPELRHAFATDAMVREARRRGLGASLVFALALAVSFVAAEAGLLLMFLLGAVDRIPVPGLRPAPDAPAIPH